MFFRVAMVAVVGLILLFVFNIVRDGVKAEASVPDSERYRSSYKVEDMGWIPVIDDLGAVKGTTMHAYRVALGGCRQDLTTFRTVMVDERNQDCYPYLQMAKTIDGEIMLQVAVLDLEKSTMFDVGRFYVNQGPIPGDLAYAAWLREQGQFKD